MCGIVGYAGKSDSVPFMIKGLKLLEYRGYDSAGIATLDPTGQIQIRKKIGVLKNLEESLGHSCLSGRLGIGHTRWATHGKPSGLNAHPHLDGTGEISVVHNGIIENHHTLKKELQEQGAAFVSETDSEVVPHLIFDFHKQGLSIEDAFFKALSRLKGAYALVMIAKDAPDTLFATRRGSPLLAGIGDGEVFLGSDCQPLLEFTQDILYLEEGDVLIVKNGKASLFDIDRNPKEIRTVKVDKKELAGGFEGFACFTQKEIFEQPEILERILQMRLQGTPGKKKIVFEELTIPSDFLNSIDRITITGCGTAYHAGFLGRYYLEEVLDLPVETLLSSEFRYARSKLSEKNLVIAISQSGETADTLASIMEAKRKGAKVLSVVNVLNSSIDRESDHVVYTHAGSEIGVASTKAFTSQVLALFLLSLKLAELRNLSTGEVAPALIEDLEALPQKVRQVLDQEKHIRDVSQKYHLATSALYLGRHMNYPIALEGALKNKEISYMHAEGYAAGEMKHGPIALIDRTLPVICICTESRTIEKMISNVKEVEAREGILISLVTEGEKQISSISREVIVIPKTHESLAPLLNAIVLQILAYYFAHFKGLEIDKPRNLAKSVTVE